MRGRITMLMSEETDPSDRQRQTETDTDRSNRHDDQPRVWYSESDKSIRPSPRGVVPRQHHPSLLAGAPQEESGSTSML
jgi:hypothetical protein